jgi:predicted SprT family Zn-dependent metalloprotease
MTEHGDRKAKAVGTSMLPAHSRATIARLGRLWGLSDLAATVEIRFNPRLRNSLARCRPADGRISLNTSLPGENSRRLDEVLCHELAHVAVYRLHGPDAQAHGEEWKALVRKAGFEPSVRTTAARPDTSNDARNPIRYRWEHRCPVCQTVRSARRPVTTWRCAECMDAGLDGRLVITRVSADREQRR